MIRTRYRHRLAEANPCDTLVSEVLVVELAGDCYLHITGRGYRAGSLRVSPTHGREWLDFLLPPAERVEVECE